MLTSYTPGQAPLVTDNADMTVGPTTPVSTSNGGYPAFNVIGYAADAGEVSDCLNQLVVRIQALEAFAGITST